MNQKYQCKNNSAQWVITLFILLATACTPEVFGSKTAITRVTEIPTADTPPPLAPTATEIIPLPTNVITTVDNTNLIQISSIPGSMSWESEDKLRLWVDSKWDQETACTTNFWQDFNVSYNYQEASIESTILASGDIISCPEPEPIISEASIASLPGAIVSQEVSPDRTHSLLFVEVISSTLPMIGNITEVNVEANLPMREGWVINHETGDLQPVFATQLGYGYKFMPGYHHIIVEQVCYGANLGEGLYIIDIKNKSLLTIDETYSGRCEGSKGLSPSPDGKYFIYGKGTIVNMNGQIESQLCTEEQFARSWTWSSDSQRVYIDCYYDDEQDLLWEYRIEPGQKFLLNDLPIPHVLFKARAMVVSPDKKWLAFVWGESNFFEKDEFGVWLLLLARMNK